MGAVAAKRSARREVVRDLFAVPTPTSAPALVPAPPAREPAEPPTSLRRRRDFDAPVERVDAGPHLVIRTLVTEPTRSGTNRAVRFHEYRAYELVADGESYTVLAPGDAAYGCVDTRRNRGADPFEHQFARAAEAVELIGRLCPEAALAKGEMPASVGVYSGPGYVRITSNPEARLAKLRAEWRPTP